MNKMTIVFEGERITEEEISGVEKLEITTQPRTAASSKPQTFEIRVTNNGGLMIHTNSGELLVRSTGNINAVKLNNVPFFGVESLLAEDQDGGKLVQCKRCSND